MAPSQDQFCKSVMAKSLMRGPLKLVAGLGTVGLLAFLFLKIWSEVEEGDARAIDAAILLKLRVPGHLDIPIGPAWLKQAMIALSDLGSFTVLALLIITACGYLLVKGARGRAILLATATLSGGAAVLALKDLIGRPRPTLVDHLVSAQFMSFPSGHAANSAIVYLTIAALAIDVEPNVRARTYILIVAITLTVLIGLSRLYLGVHWPSDVAAGWALGAAWALAWRLAVGRILFGQGLMRQP